MLNEPFGLFDELICGFGDKDFEYDDILDSGAIKYKSTTIETDLLVFAEQIHRDIIVEVSEDILSGFARNEPAVIPQADALITNKREVYLCVKYADCIPILLYDPKRKVIAGIHSGRTGTERNIAGKTIAAMKQIFDSDSSDILAATGPSICSRHYPVSEDIFRRFLTETGVEQTPNSLDLKKVVHHQLHDAGIKEENIMDYPVCTFEDESYYSYRRTGTLKRQIAFIGLKNG